MENLGHGDLSPLLVAANALEQCFLTALTAATRADSHRAQIPAALAQSITLTASASTLNPVLAGRQRLLEDAFGDYLTAESTCLDFLLERSKRSLEKLSQLKAEKQSFQYLSMAVWLVNFFKYYIQFDKIFLSRNYLWKRMQRSPSWKRKWKRTYRRSSNWWIALRKRSRVSCKLLFLLVAVLIYNAFHTQ